MRTQARNSHPVRVLRSTIRAIGCCGLICTVVFQLAVSLQVSAASDRQPNASVQTVNRANKGDRFIGRPDLVKTPRELVVQPPPAARLPNGCEPMVSIVAADAQLARVAGRCVS